MNGSGSLETHVSIGRVGLYYATGMTTVVRVSSESYNCATPTYFEARKAEPLFRVFREKTISYWNSASDSTRESLRAPAQVATVLRRGEGGAELGWGINALSGTTR
jgi:hypothetical protein